MVRRRPSRLAVVPHTGCAYLRLPVIHKVVFVFTLALAVTVAMVTAAQYSALSAQYPKVPSTYVKVIVLSVAVKGLISKHAP